MLSIVIDRVRRIGLMPTLGVVAKRLAAAAKNLSAAGVRTCDCCQHYTLFLQLGDGVEAIRCFRCGANTRYELLASVLRELVSPEGTDLRVVECDPNSPLRTELEHRYPNYLRTCYRPEIPRGALLEDGSRCEDMTEMTFASGSVAIFVSSDVMEHIPRVDLAIQEVARVLIDGGQYFFTVPLSELTRPRARVQKDGEVIHLESQIYHLDPLDPKGALVFWDFSPDFGGMFERYGLRLECVRSRGAYKVWKAVKLKGN